MVTSDNEREGGDNEGNCESLRSTEEDAECAGVVNDWCCCCATTLLPSPGKEW